MVHLHRDIWLWLTVLFANFAEALAEGRGKAQAAALRAMRTDTLARLLDGSQKPAAELRPGDVVVVAAGEPIPGDGRSSKASRRWTSPPSPASRRR